MKIEQMRHLSEDPSVEHWVGESVWAGTRAPLTAATGLPPQMYTDESFFSVERSRVFERAWVAVGNAAEVTEAGRLLVRQVGGRSILITRDQKGVLRGFVNSCRHRGTELATSDCDIGKTIRCPYHRWGYRLDGSLQSTPFFEEIPRADFSREDFGLVEVRVDTWGLLLFACVDPATPPLRQWLGDLPDRMGGYGFDKWRVQSEMTFEVRANWKLISENFQEYYHLSWVHPELAKVSRVKDHYRYQGPGMYCGQTTTPVSGDDRDDWLVLPPATGLDQSDSVSGRFVAVFPNVMLAVLPNHVFLIRLEPVAPGLTRERCTFLLPPSTPDVSDEDMAQTRSFWVDVNNEDIDIVERGQRGVTAGAIAPGPLAPRFEEPLHRFHNMLADTLTVECGADIAVPCGDDDSEAARLGSGVNPHPPEFG
ncbi:MAG: aromatic ring-hydroxylating dioxygenase subunit alpha [Acidimicrobiaceae bacterium]|nr:aromatic ring-hydroxylating dioxygenase subunit alpha [Acidimicrobiaceae bacterium]MYG56382.1 aromatic ring-hydroxylating dioxygenase subunit alpha [Acidimicrobiaceae bacterium]MYJ97608.1 aromatic ring-hydroxylating dioxygenase subunit alpha [Acidimicrobiaceae bacterium]